MGGVTGGLADIQGQGSKQESGLRAGGPDQRGGS